MVRCRRSRHKLPVAALPPVAVVALAIVLLLSSCSPGSTEGVAAFGARLSDTTTDSVRPTRPSGIADVPRSLVTAAPRRVDHSADERFDAQRAMADIRALTAIGVRAPGSAEESQGAAWVASRLRDLGYDPQIETFRLPNGRESHNVFVVVPGTSTERMILGAHIDSKPPSPGANDDASGVGILLDIARLLKKKPAARTVEIVFFGAEEISDGNPDHHHAGSRYRASMLLPAERSATKAMLSVDMASYGTKAYVRTMGVGPMTFAKTVIAEGKRLGLPIKYWRDPGSSGWSDHEPFEKLGIPSAWLEWLEDPAYHTTGDTAGRLSVRVVKQSGDLVLALVRAEN